MLELIEPSHGSPALTAGDDGLKGVVVSINSSHLSSADRSEGAP